MENSIQGILNGQAPSRWQLAELLEYADVDLLGRYADKVRERHLGSSIHLRGIIEFSSYCGCRCAYCGLAADSGGLKRFRMEPSEIVAVSEQAYMAGYRTIILQSGEDPYYDAGMIAECVRAIKALGAVAVVLSIGERREDELKMWREAGADRYLLKHETSDASLYQKLHRGDGLGKRLANARAIKQMGYQLGGGFMVGLPGQTYLTLADDILLLKTLGVEMAGIGPFIPHPETELSGVVPGDVTLSLKVLSLTRLLLPKVHLPATTALATLDAGAAERALNAGANVIMRKVEPLQYRAMYDIYPRPAAEMLSIAEQWSRDEVFIRSLGRQVDDGKGDGYLVNVKENEAYV